MKDSTVAYRLRGQLRRFVGIVFPHEGKVMESFLADMFFGMQTAQSVAMLGEKFTLDIRPTFVNELDRAAAYIELHLRNPKAADKLVADVYEAIDSTLAHPLVTAPKYRPPDVRQPYYAIQVRHCTIYYIVHDHLEVVLDNDKEGAYAH